MDPATIYAITVTLAGIGLPPEVQVERLPPQWTMADCIKDHEQKLAGRPNTMARCVSKDRPFTNADDADEPVVYGIDIVFGYKNRNPTVSVFRPTPAISMEECKTKYADIFANRRGVRAYCVKTRTPPLTCDPNNARCAVVPS